ncbi:MAG TPA: HNH endonuclease [Mycobacteriales bacterium]
MWRKIANGVFMPVFPVYVTADDTAQRLFTITLDEIRHLGDPVTMSPDVRRYAQDIVNRRLHQPEFRGRVLRAYERHCTVCKLDRPQLIDAAHIVPDGHPLGDPIVRNGLALCKIHHAAYDANILGISPDSIVHINEEVMQVIDGPMLEHGLKDMNGQTLLWSPQRSEDHPDRDRLALRFDEFRASV